VPTPDGAFYAYADVTGLLGRTWGGNDVRSSLDLADLLLDKAEIAAVPGEAFGPSGFLRFSYALSDDAITEGIGRFADVVAAG
jgi:aspartate aminotransferase